MIGYKGFDSKMQCRGFQYKVGETYKHGDTLSLCNSGFHFCENPLDVLRYYGPATSKYAEVEADGVSDQKDKDSKRVSSQLTIKADLSLSALIGLGVKFCLSNTTDKAPGNSSPAATSGYSSHAATSGKESIAASIGREAQAKASLGSWIVLAEYKPDSCEVLTVKTAKVDGKKIKADTFYKLSKGKFVQVKE